MKKNDLFLASAMVIIALVWFLSFKIFSTDGNSIKVYKDNQLIETYDINENTEFSIFDSDRSVMKVRIDKGSCDVIYADCPDNLCVHQKSISKDKETIVCLPNRIVIEICSEEDEYFESQSDENNSDLDAVVY